MRKGSAKVFASRLRRRLRGAQKTTIGKATQSRNFAPKKKKRRFFFSRKALKTLTGSFEIKMESENAKSFAVSLFDIRLPLEKVESDIFFGRFVRFVSSSFLLGRGCDWPYSCLTAKKVLSFSTDDHFNSILTDLYFFLGRSFGNSYLRTKYLKILHFWSIFILPCFD